MTDAEKREKVIRGLECCKWSRQTVKPEKNKCDECPYKDKSIMNAFTVWRSCTNVLAGDALALLNERGAKVKPQFDDDALDRNTYIKVGDLIDCMTELSMPEDASFHLAGAIEWACKKRAVALLKEPEARVMTWDELMNCANGDPAFIESRDRSCCWVLIYPTYMGMHDKNGYGVRWRYWTSRPSEQQMANTPWDVSPEVRKKWELDDEIAGGIGQTFSPDWKGGEAE